MLAAQAARAQVEALGFTAYGDGGGVYIGRPAAVGVALRMADIMPEHRRLAAQFTLQNVMAPLTKQRTCYNMLLNYLSITGSCLQGSLSLLVFR